MADGAGMALQSLPQAVLEVTMTPHQALLSKLKRERSRLSFRRDHCHGVHLWHASGLGEGSDDAEECRRLTWLLIDLDERIRELQYSSRSGT